MLWDLQFRVDSSSDGPHHELSRTFFPPKQLIHWRCMLGPDAGVILKPCISMLTPCSTSTKHAGHISVMQLGWDPRPWSGFRD